MVDVYRRRSILTAGSAMLLSGVTLALNACGSSSSGYQPSSGGSTSLTQPAPAGAAAARDLVVIQADGYAISLPGTPKRVVIPTGPAAGVTYIVDNGDSRTAIGTSLVRQHPKPDVNSVLTGGVAGVAVPYGGTVRDQINTTYQGFPARDARITGMAGNKATTFLRLIYARRRLYQLQTIVTGGDQKTPPPFYARFLSSLRIA